MATLRLPARKAPPAASEPPSAPTPATAASPQRTPEDKAERVHAQAEHDRQAHLEAQARHDKRARLGLAALRRRWPDLFTRAVPLAVGVRPQIREAMPEMPSAQLSEVLRFWTMGSAYLLAVATGVERRNLDGSPAGVPAEDQQAFAQETLRKRGKWPVVKVQAAAEAVVGEQPEGDPA